MDNNLLQMWKNPWNSDKGIYTVAGNWEKVFVFFISRDHYTKYEPQFGIYSLRFVGSPSSEEKISIPLKLLPFIPYLLIQWIEQ